MPTTSTAMAAFATIAARSRRHYGVIDPVLAEATLSPANLKRLRRAGLIQNRYRGVDVIAAAPPCPEQDLLAAVMAVGGTVGGAARSAAATWRLRDHWPQFPEVVVAGSRRPRIAGIVIHRNVALTPRHLTTFRHIPLTKPAVTLLGLAAVEESQGRRRLPDPRTEASPVDRGRDRSRPARPRPVRAGRHRPAARGQSLAPPRRPPARLGPRGTVPSTRSHPQGPAVRVPVRDP